MLIGLHIFKHRCWRLPRRMASFRHAPRNDSGYRWLIASIEQPDKHQFELHTHHYIKDLICAVFAAQQEQGTEQSFHASRLGILGRSG